MAVEGPALASLSCTDLDTLLPSIHGDSQTEWTDAESFSRAQPESSGELETSLAIVARSDRSDAGVVEQIASEVLSLADALRPAGTISGAAESILDSLRHEVETGDLVTKSEIAQQHSAVSSEAGWESVETPAAVQTETRPLKYLFSMLRRKQQGL